VSRGEETGALAALGGLKASHQIAQPVPAVIKRNFRRFRIDKSNQIIKLIYNESLYIVLLFVGTRKGEA
jgi:hypothetical protein